MADITMCDNNTCSRRKFCYRFTAPKNDLMQSYFTGKTGPNNDCGYFWDNKGMHVNTKIDEQL